MKQSSMETPLNRSVDAGSRRNGLKRGTYGLAALILGFGLFVQLGARKPEGAGRTEDWLESLAPRSLAGFSMLPGREDPNQSYKMDARTYEELKPFGIVVRVYRKANKAFDVALVASDRKESFHDQRVCFASQGWTLTGDRLAKVQTKTRGAIPASILTLASSTRGSQLAVVVYRGPGGFHSSPRGLTWAMLLDQLGGGKHLESVFYRIMPVYSGATEAELLAFAGQYLDAAHESSGGYF